MTDTFSDTLQHDNHTTWSAAVEHRFVQELHAGTVPDGVMAGYLIQDHRFLDGFLTLLGSAIATADTFEARLVFSRFAGEVAGDENTYFDRALGALGVSATTLESTPDLPATAGFKQLFQDAAEARSYAATLAVLVVTEWLYHDWATGGRPSDPDSFVHSEWIGLHDNPQFAEFVGFLRTELDRVGPTERAVATEYFRRTVDLELQFFDLTYEHPVEGAGR